MNKTTFIVVAVAALLVAGSFGLSQASTSSNSDPRIDQIIEQNEKILKNQEDLQKQIAQIKDWVEWLRRRSS